MNSFHFREREGGVVYCAVVCSPGVLNHGVVEVIKGVVYFLG